MQKTHVKYDCLLKLKKSSGGLVLARNGLHKHALLLESSVVVAKIGRYFLDLVLHLSDVVASTTNFNCSWSYQ